MKGHHNHPMMGSDFTDDRGPEVVRFQCVWGVLATIAVILRFCGRYATPAAGLWWDDWLSLVALVSVTPFKRLQSLTMIVSIAAICLVNLWSFALLGLHRPRQTHQSDPWTAHTTSKVARRKPRSIQHRIYHSQALGATFLCSHLPECPYILHGFLGCRVNHYKLVHSYQLPCYLFLHSHSQSLGSSNTGPLS